MRLLENTVIKNINLSDKIFKTSGFKRIGAERIVYDYIKGQLRFMRQDSLEILDTKLYEEDTYMAAIFDNPKANCFYASLHGGYLVTINTISQQKMSVLKLDRRMAINQMIWIENEQFLLAAADDGSLQVISTANNALRIKQSFMVREGANIYSLQMSITNPNEVILSTSIGVLLVTFEFN